MSLAKAGRGSGGREGCQLPALLACVRSGRARTSEAARRHRPWPRVAEATCSSSKRSVPHCIEGVFNFYVIAGEGSRGGVGGVWLGKVACGEQEAKQMEVG